MFPVRPDSLAEYHIACVFVCMCHHYNNDNNNNLTCVAPCTQNEVRHSLCQENTGQKKVKLDGTNRKVDGQTVHLFLISTRQTCVNAPWVLTNMFCDYVSEGRRNALQDYQKTDGTRLVVTSPDASQLTKTKKLSMAKCAKACSRNRRLPFTCRYACTYQHSPLEVQIRSLSHSVNCCKYRQS